MSTLLERFLSKVQIERTGCCEWTATTDGRGYGHIRVGDKKVKAYRVAWELFVGPIPKGMHVLHTCDNPLCVRWQGKGVYVVGGVSYLRHGHLWLGDHAANMADMSAKGRATGWPDASSLPRGVDRIESKLTEQQVVAIRTSSDSQRTLAARYGVSQVAISKVKRRKTWAHIL